MTNNETLKRAQEKHDNMLPDDYWDCPMDHDEEGLEEPT